MISNLINAALDRGAKQDPDPLPTREEFRELSTMLKAGALAGGAHFTPDQCRMLSKTFAKLSVATITVDD